jgi:SLT domain-containing protein
MLQILVLILNFSYSLRDNHHEFVSRILYQASSRCGYRIQKKDVEKVTKLIEKESNFKVTALNKRSKAYGLYQFLPKTFKSLKYKKTSCPIKQTEAFLRYVKTRYGTINKAYVFRTRNGWY